MTQIWDNEARSDAELRAKLHQRLIEFRRTLNQFVYKIAQMEVMIEDYIDLKDGRERLE